MDRITRVRIENARVIESLDLEVRRPLTVLIGENGSGKSTIVECLELLRGAGEPGFVAQLYSLHRGVRSLWRQGAPHFEFGVRVEDDAGVLPPVDYTVRLTACGTGTSVCDEQILLDGVRVAECPRVPAALRGIDVRRSARNGLRGGLVDDWSALLDRGAACTARALDLVRLGLGERVDTVSVMVDADYGDAHLAVRFTDLTDPVLASDLSDGQVAWLAFVAMARLNEGRSLLAVDEPELHLHPALLGRVVSLLDNLEGGTPVMFSTHSDRVLEMLDDPTGAVRVCSLEGNVAAVSRIDPVRLSLWLDRFGDLGQLRAAGYLERVLVAKPQPQE